MGSSQIRVQVNESELRLYPLSQVPQFIPSQLRQLSIVQLALVQDCKSEASLKPVLQVRQVVLEAHSTQLDMVQVASMHRVALPESTVKPVAQVLHTLLLEQV